MKVVVVMVTVVMVVAVKVTGSSEQSNQQGLGSGA